MPNRDPLPVLDPSYTASFMENVVVRPSPIPGYLDIVRVPDGSLRATLKCAREP